MRKPETKTKPQYTVRRVHLGRTAQLDELAHACGQVYSWSLRYDPNGSGGSGTVTATLDGETASYELSPQHRSDGAEFNHFGVVNVMKQLGIFEEYPKRPNQWRPGRLFKTALGMRFASGAG